MKKFLIIISILCITGCGADNHKKEAVSLNQTSINSVSGNEQSGNAEAGNEAEASSNTAVVSENAAGVSDNTAVSDNAADNDNTAGDSEQGHYYGASYCATHDIEAVETRNFTSSGVIYYPQNPAYSNVVEANVDITNVSREIHGDMAVLTVGVNISMQGLYTNDGIDYSSAVTPMVEFADDYTGIIIPTRSTKGNESFSYGLTLNEGTESIDINYSLEVNYSRGRYVSIGGENYQRPINFTAEYTFEIPSDYKGLVMKVTPKTDLNDINAATIDSEKIYLDDYVPSGTVFVKIRED